jgi:hypothetical protein
VPLRSIASAGSPSRYISPIRADCIRSV